MRSEQWRERQRQSKLGRARVAGLEPSEPVTTQDIVWAAGIFEGEGSCSRIGGGAQSEHASVEQKDSWVTERLRSYFGGSEKPRRDRSMHMWYIDGARARGFLQSIYGLMSPRRQEQIRRALQVEEK